MSSKLVLQTCPTCGNIFKNLSNHIRQSEGRCSFFHDQRLLVEHQQSFSKFSDVCFDVPTLINHSPSSGVAPDDALSTLTTPPFSDDFSIGGNDCQEDNPSQQECSAESPNCMPTSSFLPKLCPVPDAGFQVLPEHEMCLLRIMTFCDEAGCPRYFYDKLMKMLTHEHLYHSFDLSMSHPKRETLLRHVTRICGNATRPTQVPVMLDNIGTARMYNQDAAGSGSDFSNVFCFDFESQLRDLLSDDAIFGSLMNLDVNPSNRFGKFARHDSCLNEVNSGSWYNHTFNHVVTNPNEDFLLPIIIFVDKTGTDKLQRHSVEPVIFTTSVITWSCRQQTRAWRALGYIPDLHARSSASKEAARNKEDNKGRSHREYHACLRQVLESLIKAQQSGIMFDLRLGDQVKTVRLRVPVAFVMNDGKSADMLTGRYGSYNFGRVSRACNCQFENLSDTSIRCQYIIHQTVSNLQQKAPLSFESNNECGNVTDAERNKAVDELQRLSVHVFKNAFDDVDFGGDPRGIFGCTPTDLMHAFLEGVLKHAMIAIFDTILPSKKILLDRLVDDVIRSQRSCIREVYPRTNFSKGFTNLTLLTANEWLGVCFTLMLLSMMDRGIEVLSSSCTGGSGRDDNGDDSTVDPENESICDHSDDEESEDNNDIQPQKKKRKVRQRLPCSVNGLREVLEALLCFYAFTKRKLVYDMSTPQRHKRIRVSVATFLNMVKARLPRGGNGWKLQKFHDLMHLSDDIYRYGSPRNTDAGCGERALKFFAKAPSHTAQKRDTVFLEQLSLRLHEREQMSKLKRITDPLGQWTIDLSDVGTSSENHSADAVNACTVPVHDDDDKSVDDSSSDKLEEEPTSDATCSSDDDDDDVNGGEFVGRPKFKITISADGLATVSDLGRKATRGFVALHPVVVRWFESRSKTNQHGGESTYLLWTEYKKNDGTKLRAHPNYRSDGEWNDWCFSHFGADDDHGVPSKRKKPSFLLMPAKVLCFYYDPTSAERRALVHGCRDHDVNSDSVLCEVWRTEYTIDKNTRMAVPRLRTLMVQSLLNPVLVVAEFPGLHEEMDEELVECMSRCILVKDMENDWGDLFA